MDAPLVPLTDGAPYLTLEQWPLEDAVYLIAGYRPPDRPRTTMPHLMGVARTWLLERRMVFEDDDNDINEWTGDLYAGRYVVVAELMAALRAQNPVVWGDKLIEGSRPVRLPAPKAKAAALSIDDKREQALRAWLRAEKVPAGKWHQLQSIGYSKKKIFAGLHARDTKLFPAFNYTFERFWKSQATARLR